MEVILGMILYTIVGLLIFFLAFMALLYARIPMHCAVSLEDSPKANRFVIQVEKRREMIKEMFRQMFKEKLSKEKLFDKQKDFWWVSSTLFLGVCFIAVWTLFLIGGAVTGLAGVAVDAHTTPVAALLYYPTIPAGIGGFTLTTFGLVVLILRRLNDPSLKKQLYIQDFFDTFLAFGVMLTGLLLWGGDLSFAGARSVMAQILSFSQNLQINPLLFIHLVLLDIMIIYFPLSRMISYGNKFFTLRRVVTDNEFVDADRQVKD